jgi:hypothetical protein
MCLFSVKSVSGKEGTTMFQDDHCMIYKGQILVFHTAMDPHSNYHPSPILEKKKMLNLSFHLDFLSLPLLWSPM